MADLAASWLGKSALVGAPSYAIFGAFFPAWLLCAVLGLLASVLVRALVIAVGLDRDMPLKLITYSAVAVLAATWLWLSLFGER